MINTKALMIKSRILILDALQILFSIFQVISENLFGSQLDLVWSRTAPWFGQPEPSRNRQFQD